jgi:hypothetical protein
MTETNHDGFWSAIEALGGQYVPPSLQAAVAEAKEKIHQLELDFETAVEKVEVFVGLEPEPVAAPVAAPVAVEEPVDAK